MEYMHLTTLSLSFTLNPSLTTTAMTMTVTTKAKEVEVMMDPNGGLLRNHLVPVTKRPAHTLSSRDVLDG
jgi:hypothetical protein